MTDTHRYPAQVFWSAADEGFIALAPDLPGCSAFGDTQEEALRELQDAIEAWIGAQRSAGHPIPEPSVPVTEYNGKVLVRMPRELHARLSQNAKFQNVSLNHYIVYLLASGSTAYLPSPMGSGRTYMANAFVGAERHSSVSIPLDTMGDFRLSGRNALLSTASEPWWLADIANKPVVSTRRARAPRKEPTI